MTARVELVVLAVAVGAVLFMVYDTALEASEAVEFLKWVVTAFIGGRALERHGRQGDL